MKTKIAIVHFLPLEFYPPITNLISFIANNGNREYDVEVFSLANNKNRVPFNLNNKRISLNRFPYPVVSTNIVKSFLGYFKFHFVSFWKLIQNRPSVILYYESYSSFPVFLYKFFINSDVKIYVHFHEYFSKAWYGNTMKQVRVFHYLEKKFLFKYCDWISQTNQDRLDLFYSDHSFIDRQNLKIMPNYPPQSWKQNCISKKYKPLKLVYVGSLSLTGSYFEQICHWVSLMNGQVLLDVYSYNFIGDIRDFLSKLDCSFIQFFEGGVEYNNQPALLRKYDVGLIIYKPHSLNYKYNAPNKLFEYTACGLDVWYSCTLEGPKPYQKTDSFPRILEVNFEELNSFDVKTLYFNQPSLAYSETNYFCEPIYQNLLNHIDENINS